MNSSTKSPDNPTPIRWRRRGARTRAVQRKRFYASAGVGEADGGFSVTLDGKPIKTPSGRTVDRAGAFARGDDRGGMECARRIHRSPDHAADALCQQRRPGRGRQVDAVSDDVAKYLGSDLLFYRAGHPEALVAREAAHWDPILFWAADALGAHFILAEGVMHVRQPDEAIAAARAALPDRSLAIAALHVITTLTGSALLALALFHGVIDPDQVWAAAHVDEDWNAEKWGVDEEVAARKAAKLVDFKAVAAALKALRQAVDGASSIASRLTTGLRHLASLPACFSR